MFSPLLTGQINHFFIYASGGKVSHLESLFPLRFTPRSSVHITAASFVKKVHLFFDRFSHPQGAPIYGEPTHRNLERTGEQKKITCFFSLPNAANHSFLFWMGVVRKTPPGTPAVSGWTQLI